MRSNASVTRLLLGALVAVPAFLALSVVQVQFGSAGVGIGVQSAQAQDDDEERPQRRTRRAMAVSERVNKQLAEVSELLNPEEEDAEPDLQGALRELNDINPDSWSDYEKAQLYNLYGAVYVQLERYEDAIRYYQMYVDTPDIPEAQELNVSWYLAQLYLATEQYRQAIRLLEDYIARSEIVGGDHYFKLGQAYYQAGNEDKAIVNVDKAIQLYEDADRLPTESMYQYQYSLYASKEDYDKVISILEKMLRHYPKVRYWKVLGSMYAQTNQQQKQLSTYEALYEMGGLDKEKELLVLASLYLEAEYPYKAAKIIDEGIEDDIIEPTPKNLQTLAGAWSLAKESEEAIPVLEEAAQKSSDGELYVRLQQQYASNDDHQNAISAGREALQRGGIKKPAQVHLYIGIAHFELDQFDQALQAFRQARTDKTVADQARQWIRFTEAEKERVEKLQAAG